MKKIAFYGIKYFPSRGGTSRVAENLIFQLREKYDITIYCYQNESAEKHIEGVKVIQFKPRAEGALGAFIYFFMTAIHLVVKGNYDVIHTHKTDCALFIPFLRLRYKVISTSHEAPYKRDKWNKLIKLYFHLVEKIFVRSPNIATCISQPLTDYYTDRYKHPVTFIPNGINLLEPKDFNLEKAKSFLPEGASIKIPFVLFSARRLMSTKGCHTMLEALKQINYSGQIFIAGELEESKYLKQLKKLSLGLNVYFLGFVNPLPALLALIEKSELFIFPSETEGMSIMLLEVASVGRPIVASDIPENTQIFTNNEVLYFKSKDVSDLAEKLKFALKEHNAMNSFAQKAQTTVYKDFTWSSIASSYADLYNKLA